MTWSTLAAVGGEPARERCLDLRAGAWHEIRDSHGPEAYDPNPLRFPQGMAGFFAT
jgi:hypothetical protein